MRGRWPGIAGNARRDSAHGRRHRRRRFAGDRAPSRRSSPDRVLTCSPTGFRRSPSPPASARPPSARETPRPSPWTGIAPRPPPAPGPGTRRPRRRSRPAMPRRRAPTSTPAARPDRSPSSRCGRRSAGRRDPGCRPPRTQFRPRPRPARSGIRQAAQTFVRCAHRPPDGTQLTWPCGHQDGAGSPPTRADRPCQGRSWCPWRPPVRGSPAPGPSSRTRSPRRTGPTTCARSRAPLPPRSLAAPRRARLCGCGRGSPPRTFPPARCRRCHAPAPPRVCPGRPTPGAICRCRRARRSFPVPPCRRKSRPPCRRAPAPTRDPPPRSPAPATFPCSGRPRRRGPPVWSPPARPRWPWSPAPSPRARPGWPAAAPAPSRASRSPRRRRARRRARRGRERRRCAPRRRCRGRRWPRPDSRWSTTRTRRRQAFGRSPGPGPPPRQKGCWFPSPRPPRNLWPSPDGRCGCWSLRRACRTRKGPEGGEPAATMLTVSHPRSRADRSACNPGWSRARQRRSCHPMLGDVVGGGEPAAGGGLRWHGGCTGSARASYQRRVRARATWKLGNVSGRGVSCPPHQWGVVAATIRGLSASGFRPRCPGDGGAASGADGGVQGLSRGSGVIAGTGGASAGTGGSGTGGAATGGAPGERFGRGQHRWRSVDGRTNGHAAESPRPDPAGPAPGAPRREAGRRREGRRRERVALRTGGRAATGGASSGGASSGGATRRGGHAHAHDHDGRCGRGRRDFTRVPKVDRRVRRRIAQGENV